MTIRAWWKDDPQERYWLETTERRDLGADLNAPQSNHRGDEYWSYSLVRAVRDGDVVFHYEMGRRTISTFSCDIDYSRSPTASRARSRSK
jgi:hypothetical protein